MRVSVTGSRIARATRSGIAMAAVCGFVATLTMAAVGQSHTLKVAQKTNWVVVEKFEYLSGGTWTAVEETDASVTYSGTWGADACGAFSQMSSIGSGAYCEFSFTGTGVRWYDEGEPAYQSDVYLDGVLLQTVTTVVGNCTMMQYENSDISGVSRKAGGSPRAMASGTPVMTCSPDPLRGSLVIRGVLPVNASEALLAIQDLRGRTLWRDRLSIAPGSEGFTYRWDHRSAPGGVFVVTMSTFDKTGRKTSSPARVLTSLP